MIWRLRNETWCAHWKGRQRRSRARVVKETDVCFMKSLNPLRTWKTVNGLKCWIYFSFRGFETAQWQAGGSQRYKYAVAVEARWARGFGSLNQGTTWQDMEVLWIWQSPPLGGIVFSTCPSVCLSKILIGVICWMFVGFIRNDYCIQEINWLYFGSDTNSVKDRYVK